MSDIISWLSDNREWLFNGTGTEIIVVVATIISGIFSLIYYWLRHNKKIRSKQTQITGDNSVALQVGDSLTINDSQFGGKNVK